MFDFRHSTSLEKIGWLGLRLQEHSNYLRTLELYYRGRQPTSYLPTELVTQLGDRMVNLNVNYCKLVVSTLIERLKVTGFRVDGSDTADPQLWADWRRNEMQIESAWLLRDVLALGKGYLSVWVDDAGNPLINVESPHQVYAYRDPKTREILGMLKMWGTFDAATNAGRSWAVLYLPDRVETYFSDSGVPANSVPPINGWTLGNVTKNPLGVVPIVEFRNATDVLDWHGTSAYSDVMPLVDWLNKSALDLASASDDSGAPRKFLSGLVIQEDEDGNPIDPFSKEKNRVWTAEDPAARMQQFDGAALTNFVEEARFIIRQICSVSGLPEHMAGLGAANPTSADAIRAANLSLTSRADTLTTVLTPGFTRVGQLVKAIETGRRADAIDVEPLWAPIEDRSMSMTSDSVSKLVAAGVPLALALEREAGWTPSELAALERAQQRQALLKAAQSFAQPQQQDQGVTDGQPVSGPSQ